MTERRLRDVPKPILLLLALGLGLQLAWHSRLPPPNPRPEALPRPPSLAALQLASLGEPVALAKLLMLRLQAFDTQAGVSLPFRRLDYGAVEAWLAAILRLDPQGQYPLLAAARLYAEVNDEPKQRRMLDFIHREFLLDPNRRWPWLAHAALLAKHRLHDLPLARKYAEAIRLHATGPEVPHWASQMEIFILEDMNELESARILLGGLLQSGKLTDPHEIRFLSERLDEMAKKESRPPNPRQTD